MNLRLIGLTALLFTILASAPVAMAAAYNGARELGPADLSVGCPAGSQWHWDPVKGGRCLSCPAGSSLVLFQCRRVIPGVAEQAQFAYRRASVLKKCRRGTFPAGVTRNCFKCREGLRHNGALPVEVAGVCFHEPKVHSDPATVVSKVTVGDLVSPARLIGEISTLGCTKHGRRAFLDPVRGGTCWTCPASHPVRTRYAVTGGKACASKACGKLGERPCMVWERAYPSCNKGLVEDPIANKCVSPKNLACNSIIRSAKILRNSINRANATGEALKDAALDKIPGLRAMMHFVETQSGHAQKQMDAMIRKLPLDRMLADLDVAFPTPEVETRVNAVIAALGRRQAEIERALLDTKEICGGNPKKLQQIFREAVAEAGFGPGDGDAAGGRRLGLGDIFGPSRAHAATQPWWAGWTIAYSFAPVLNARINGVTVPLQLFGIQVAYRTGATWEDDAVTFFLTGGADFVHPKIDITEFGALENFITVSWPKPSCNPGWLGAGLVVSDTIGFGFGCDKNSPVLIGLNNVSLKFYSFKRLKNPTINVTDVKGMLTKSRSSMRWEGKGPSLELTATFGPNVMVPLRQFGPAEPSGGFAQ